MKKIIVNLIILSLLFTACTNNNFDKTNGNTDNVNNEISGNSEAIENPGEGKLEYPKRKRRLFRNRIWNISES